MYHCRRIYIQLSSGMLAIRNRACLGETIVPFPSGDIFGTAKQALKAFHSVGERHHGSTRTAVQAFSFSYTRRTYCSNSSEPQSVSATWTISRGTVGRNCARSSISCCRSSRHQSMAHDSSEDFSRRLIWLLFSRRQYLRVDMRPSCC